jgi:hypothetical protein
MNYEKFKRSDRPDRFHSQFDITVNDFLSVVGEKFFNDWTFVYKLKKKQEKLTVV